MTEYVRRIRNKFSAAGYDGNLIETVWGMGYVWRA